MMRSMVKMESQKVNHYGLVATIGSSLERQNCAMCLHEERVSPNLACPIAIMMFHIFIEMLQILAIVISHMYGQD